jgi:ADP-ribosylglycohydrolase
MRSAILGAVVEDLDTLKRFVQAATVVTHTDPKAYQGAFAVALAAWCARRGVDDPAGFFGQYRNVADDDPASEFSALLLGVEKSLTAAEETVEFAQQLGCTRGVSGYVFRTVPVALHCWLSHPQELRTAVGEVIRCGGDTDTTGAIVGAIIGTGVGRAGIPEEWVRGLWEWPRSVAWMERLAGAVEEAVKTGQPVRPPGVFPAIGLARNVVFLAAVLGHVARRLLPPY